MKTPNLDKAIAAFIKYTIIQAQKELSKTRTVRGRRFNRVASGNLKNSLYGKAKTKNGLTSIGFGSTASYAEKIEYGVNGTSKKYGSPFSFKGENINTSWVSSWMQSRGMSVEGNGATINGTKYVIGSSIARNGIIPVPYMELGTEAGLKRYDDIIFNAFTKDIEKQLDKQLK